MNKDSDYIAKLEAENALLKQEVSDLKHQLHILLSSMVAKDSHNSSFPPSRDLPSSKVKRSKSLRKKSNRKSGGQEGHKGTTLDFSACPDKVSHLTCDYCRSCGTALSSASLEFHSRRQVFDISLPTVFCVEYRVYESVCPSCGTKNKADYPSEVQAPVQYGQGVHSLISYFSTGQYIPLRRLKTLFADVFEVSLSEGTIANSLAKMGHQASLVCEEIQEELFTSKVVGSDETGCNVNGKNHWIWVWQDKENTLLKASPNRGSKTIEDIWQEGLPKAILVTDRWAAQMKTHTAHKQLCLAHLQRDVQYLVEVEKSPLASDFKEWLSEVWEAKRQSIAKQSAWKKEDKEAKALEQKLNQLLLHHIAQKQYPKTYTFQRSMCKYKKYLLTT